MNFEFQIDFSSSDSFEREGRSACTMRRAARQKNEPLNQSDLWACARRRPRPPRRAHRAPRDESLSWSERGASARASTPFCAHGASQNFSENNFCAHARISLNPTGRFQTKLEQLEIHCGNSWNSSARGIFHGFLSFIHGTPTPWPRSACHRRLINFPRHDAQEVPGRLSEAARLV